MRRLRQRLPPTRTRPCRTRRRLRTGAHEWQTIASTGRPSAAARRRPRRDSHLARPSDGGSTAASGSARPHLCLPLKPHTFSLFLILLNLVERGVL